MRDRGAGVDEESFGRLDGGHQGDLHGLMVAVVGGAQRQLPRLVDAQHGHLDRYVSAGDAVIRLAVHSITLARSSASSCS